MEFKIPTHAKNFKFGFIVMIAAGLAATGFTFSNVMGDDTKLNLGGDVSAKGVIGNATAEEHTSANANVSASSSGSEKSNAESHENYHASDMETSSHGNYDMAYEKMNANSDNSFAIETNHHIYQPGDQVSIEGTIWSNLMATVGGISSVSIQVTDNAGAIVYSGKSQVTSDGGYTADFQLPSDAKKGAYTIDTKADVNEDVLNTLTLKAQTSLESSAKFVVVSPNAFAVKAEGKDFDVQIASNSTNVSDLKFDEQQKKLSFTVQGETGTKGVTEITIPKSLLSGNMSVMIDGQAMAHSDVIQTDDTSDHITLEINYHHSTHQIDIVGTSAVPEFSSLAGLVLVFSVLSVVILSVKTRIFNIRY